MVHEAVTQCGAELGVYARKLQPLFLVAPQTNQRSFGLLGFHNKMLLTKWFKHQNFFFFSLGTWESKIKILAASASLLGYLF